VHRDILEGMYIYLYMSLSFTKPEFLNLIQLKRIYSAFISMVGLNLIRNEVNLPHLGMNLIPPY
jgi:hypothetical protein